MNAAGAAGAIGRGRSLLGVDALRWGAAAPWNAALLTFGVVVPLTLGWISGHIHYGVYAALGAYAAGIASFQGETLSRIAVMAVSLLGMAVSILVGATAAAAGPWLLVPTVAIWGYLTGLAVCLGQRVGLAVLLWSVALMIAVALPFGTADAALCAALMILGGLLQAILVAGAWTLAPGTRERRLLASSYRELAQYASQLADAGSAIPAPADLPARAVVEDPNPLLPLPTRLAFIDLLEQAERIRASLAALGTGATEGAVHQADLLRPFATKVSQALNLIAGALEAGARGRFDVNEAIGALSAPLEAPWRWAGEALLGQLRDVARMVTSLAAGPQRARDPRATGVAQRSSFDQGNLAAALGLLWANISTRSEAGRHALRLAVIASLAEALTEALHLYQGRWIVLTIFLVLKPDYASTLTRGVQRAVGTALGVVLGALAAKSGMVGSGELVAAIGISIAIAYAMLNVSYLLFSLFLTVFVVLLLELLGVPASRTVDARLLNTLIGAGLALIACAVWPTWEGLTAQEKFARMLERHRDYTEALLREVSRPGRYDPAQLRAFESAARRARSDALAGTMRLVEEPSHPPLTAEVARTLVAAAARLARAELALHVLALSARSSVQHPDASRASGPLDDLRTSIVSAMTRLSGALRDLEAPQPIPALRPIQTALAAALPSRDDALSNVADRLVDAVNTLDAIARTHLTRQPARMAASTA